MNNFKIGDNVQRITGAGDVSRFIAAQGDREYYTVSGVSTHGGWIAVDGWDGGGQDRYPWSAGNFELCGEQDDELPPAPESVLYVGMQMQQRMLRVMYGEYNTVDLYASDGRGNGKSVRLDATATLQLAHDLTRMAMEIKRKEKQHD